jgi:hypothetical protein
MTPIATRCGAERGRLDLYLIETITDTLNCKAAIKAIMDLEAEGMEHLPDLDFRHDHRPLGPHAVGPDESKPSGTP